MKLTRRNLVIMCFFLNFCLTAKSQQLERPVIYGAPFLGIVTDARSGGMGETGVSTTADTYSQFHNPTKFLFLNSESKGIGISYVPQYIGFANDIFLANVAYFHQLNDRSGLSGSLTYSSFGKMEIEEQMNNDFVNLGSFYPNEFAIDLSYGLKLNEYFGLAVTGRYIRSDITDESMTSQLELKSANAVAVDISGFYTTAFDLEKNIWSFGFNLKNVGSKLNYTSDIGYPLPTSLKIGAGYQISTGKNDKISVNFETLKFLVPSVDENGDFPDAKVLTGIFKSFSDGKDGISEELRELIFNFGSEYSFNEIFDIRLGYVYQNKSKGSNNHLTIGTGARWERLKFDFAYQAPFLDTYPIRSSNALRISISYNFGQY